jgi:hypothetical protein
MHTRGSSLLGWVKDDAAYVADRIAERAATIDGAAAEPTATELDLRVGQGVGAEQSSGVPPTA